MKYFVTAFILLLPYGLFAQSLSEGSTIPPMQIKDQFDKNIVITAQTQQIIVAFSKEEGEKVKLFLEANPNYLHEKNALYMMDVTPVPGMVMSMFMLPKFKKYPYSVGMLEDEKVVEQFPKKDKFITLLSLENFKIIAIEFKEAL